MGCNGDEADVHLQVAATLHPRLGPTAKMTNRRNDSSSVVGERYLDLLPLPHYCTCILQSAAVPEGILLRVHRTWHNVKPTTCTVSMSSTQLRDDGVPRPSSSEETWLRTEPAHPRRARTAHTATGTFGTRRSALFSLCRRDMVRKAKLSTCEISRATGHGAKWAGEWFDAATSWAIDHACRLCRVR